MKTILDLVEYLNNNGGVGLKELATLFEVSTKTASSKLSEYGDELSKYDIEISYTKDNGYSVISKNQELYKAFLKDCAENVYSTIPNNDYERVNFIINKLLKTKDYIKRSKLADMMYVSEKTVSNCLSNVEKILFSYSLRLDRKPNYGIKIIGHEFDRRQCLINRLIVPNQKYTINEFETSFVDLIKIVSKENNLQFPEISFLNLLHYIGVTINEINRGNIINEELDNKNQSIHKIADNILNSLKENNFIDDYTEGEVKYLSLFVKADRITNNSLITNFVVPDYLEDIINSIFDFIEKQYGINLNSNLDIRLYLMRHLVSLDVRLKYDIHIDIKVPTNYKEKCPFAYMVASGSSFIIENYYHKKISEKEIYLLSLFIEVALESRKVRKYNILLVCPTCKVGSLLLKVALENEFSSYINNLEMRSLYDLDNIDFSKFDYVFASVPIDINIPIPVVLISDVEGQLNIKKIKETVGKVNTLDCITTYYNKELFFTDVECEDKDEVFKFMLDKIKLHYEIKDSALELINKRESLGTTDFFDNVALPHPSEPISNEENIVCVMILKNKINWGNRKVRLVIFSSTFNSKNEETKNFYEATAKFVFNKESVNKLLEYPSYSTLINELIISNK